VLYEVLDKIIEPICKPATVAKTFWNGRLKTRPAVLMTIAKGDHFNRELYCFR